MLLLRLLLPMALLLRLLQRLLQRLLLLRVEVRRGGLWRRLPRVRAWRGLRRLCGMNNGSARLVTCLVRAQHTAHVLSAKHRRVLRGDERVEVAAHAGG
mgnify:CR=1 FL=1